VNHQFIAVYVGPDQVMPLASILATLMGFLLIFWNKLLMLLRKIAALLKRPATGHAPGQPPMQSGQAAKEPPEKA
jgi:hypothetical protein